MGRLESKVAVVTGGANGIGRACAELFAREGADVVVADVADDAGKEAVAAIEALGRRAWYVHCDATSEQDNESAMQLAVDELGALDVAVTAAGITHFGYRSGDLQAELEHVAKLGIIELDPPRQFLAMPVDDWHRVIDVNLTGTYYAVRAAARRMVEAGRGGSIVTLASIAAKHPEAGPIAYTVSKAGVWMLTKQAARALAPAGVRVNALGPGFIETNMTAIIRSLPMAETVGPMIPMGRMGTPEEVAYAALFLASDESSYFTGEILHPDGGFFTD